MQCFLCFAFTAVLGKAPCIPVFWAVLSFLFSPRGCHFLLITGHRQCCFFFPSHMFSGCQGSVVCTVSSTPFPLPKTSARKGFGVRSLVVGLWILPCFASPWLDVSVHHIQCDTPVTPRFCPFPLIDIFLGQPV